MGNSSIQTVTEARTGRRCVLCSHPERARIEAELASGTISIRGIVGRHGLAPESVRRHLTTHVAASVQQAMGGVVGAPALTVAARLLDVADSAREARAAAEAAGNLKLALSAGQAEARVLSVLLPLDALGEDIATSITEAHDALTAMATTVRAHPEVGETIAAVLEGRGRAEWAERIRAMATPNSRIEIQS